MDDVGRGAAPAEGEKEGTHPRGKRRDGEPGKIWEAHGQECPCHQGQEGDMQAEGGRAETQAIEGWQDALRLRSGQVGGTKLRRAALNASWLQTITSDAVQCTTPV